MEHNHLIAVLSSVLACLIGSLCIRVPSLCTSSMVSGGGATEPSGKAGRGSEGTADGWDTAALTPGGWGAKAGGGGMADLATAARCSCEHKTDRWQ